MSATYQKSYGVSAYLKFVGKPLVMSMTIDKDNQVFKVNLKNFTLKDLITGIVQIVKPGYELSIPVPWSYILEFNIPEFTLLLKAPKDPPSKIEFGIAFNPGFDDFGLKINKIEVFARSVREVNINMEGSLDIFGLQYDLSHLFGADGVNLLGAEGLPQPAPKPTLFDLKFIGIGQHLQLKKAASYAHVKEVVSDMLDLFDPPAPGTVVPKFSELLRFSNESDWLFGLDVEIMKTVALQAVFNDPVLYGIYLKLSGEKAKVLAGLEFEILYKKITDDIGVYQIELKLPDAIRNIEFGAVSVTLPVIAIWIYTNGNFKVDFGFPYNNNFSRSFGVQCFPFTGQGGFYFAYLNGATSVTVPQTTLGTFDPVLEFGLGMNVGLGKTFDKGIFSAGLTLTFYGILEGTLAWFKPYDNAPVNKQLTDFFYSVRGTFGIIGHIYGSVNFAIISAALDIVVYAQISVQIEAGAPILLAFEAGVSLRLTVKINLGLFKVSIHLSFSATIRESFTIGHSSPTQWNSPMRLKAAARGVQSPGIRAQQTIILNWDKVFSQGTAANITVNLIPLFSAGKTGTVQTAYGIATLFMENNRGISEAVLKERSIDAKALEAGSPFEAFDKLCIAVLSWMINAAYPPDVDTGSFESLLKQKITAATLTDILYTINHSSDTIPFSYGQIVGFISKLFVLNIIDPNTDHKEELLKNAEATNQADAKDLFLTLFPMVPQLFLANPSNNGIIDFSTFNSVNKDYLQLVTELVRQFSPEKATDNDYLEDLSKLESIATHMFRDYFLLIGKSLLQTASDVMEVYDYRIPQKGRSLAKIATAFGTNPLALITGNKAKEGLLQKDQVIVISGTVYTVEKEDTFSRLGKLRDYTKQGEAWAMEFAALNLRVQLFVPMSQISIPRLETLYRVLPEDTLETIAGKNNLSKEDTAAIIRLNYGLVILAPLTAIQLPDFTVKIPENATFLSVATEYGIQLADIARSNTNNTEMLAAGSLMTIEKVPELPIIDLLNAVYQKDFFTGAGGNASRFSLHGLRLPEVINEGDPGDKLKGLYALSGQQFTIPHIDDVTTFEYTFTLSKTKTEADTDPLPWVIFNGAVSGTKPEETASLSYTLLPEEKEMARQFQQTALKPSIKTGPKVLQLYRDQIKTFAFANPIQWDREGATAGPAIWNFSRSLNAVLPQSPEIDMKLAVQDRPGGERRITDLPTDSYSYTTFLPISIRKSGAASDSGISKSTFEVFGTDATGIELLTALLQDSQKEIRPHTVQILYAPDPANNEVKALHSFAPEDLLLLLINTNLSTETNPKRRALAASKPKISSTPVTTFIERLWKSSLVRTGGYYLYLQTADGATLPDSIFAANGDAEIYIVISYSHTTGFSPNILRPYMNAVVTTQAINASQELLFGSWKVDMEKGDRNQLVKEGRLERNAILKPGNIGFELSRINPEERYKKGDADATPNYSYQLEQQYNLLNFSTLPNEHFKAINSLLPVSPQDRDAGAASGSADNATDELWRYTKALPVARLYKSAADKSKAAFPPPAHLSPYLGLSQTLQLGFNWQDNYGNIFETSLPGLSCKILYFDQIIPLSGWPVLTIDYAFEPQSQPGDNFSLNLEFYPGDQYSWDPESRDAEGLKEVVLLRAHADLEQYVAIYYQLIEADFQISFRTSLDPEHVYPKTPAAQIAFKAGLTGYLEAVLQWIYQFIAKPDQYNQFEKSGDVPRYRYVCTYSSNIQVSQAKDIFSLSVTVDFARAENNIDPQFILTETPKAFVAGVQSVSCTVKPRLKGFNTSVSGLEQNNSDLLMLNEFARHFESTFSAAQLKVAAAYVSETDSSISGAKEEELWIVRFKDVKSENNGIGFDIRFDEAVCYAPQPLANFLVTLPNISIYPFEHYVTPEAGSPLVMSFNSVDPEVWATRFLAALETVLSPELSLPVNMIDHINGSTESTGILANLLKAKDTLARAIALQTIPVLQYEDILPGGQDIAREKIKQQLLINLSQGYAINAVVQYNTDISSPYPDEDQPIAPNLYGKSFATIAQGAAAKENYAFSTGKVPLRNLNPDAAERANSYLTYTFSTQSAGLKANLALPVDYQISHLEFDIKKLRATPVPGYSADLDKYELSKWLTFIIPLNAQNKNNRINTYIPVPIREYPALPAFSSQSFIAPALEERISIKDVKYADFLFDYNVQAYTAQDTYLFEVYFNARQSDWQVLEQARDVSKKQGALFAELAQFELVRESFTGLFRNELPKVNADISPVLLQQLNQALKAYTELVGTVAQKWLNLYSPDLFKLRSKPSIDVVKVTFDIKERNSAPIGDFGLFEVILSNWSATTKGKPVKYVNVPVVQIKDYIAEPLVNEKQNAANKVDLNDEGKIIFRYYKLIDGQKSYLSFDEGKDIKERTICFIGLSVLQIQNGWAGMYVKRNADLSDGQKQLPTAPEFIYTTPVRRFSNPVTPSKKISKEIPIPALLPKSNQLMDYLRYLFAELLSLPSGKANAVQLKILVNYTYCLHEIPVQLPVVLVPPTIFDQEDVDGTGTAIKTLHQVILDWFHTYQPALDKGVLNFAVTFYSSIDEANTLPLLNLEQITLNVADVGDLTA
jgi:LysM repeat protein